LNKNPFLLKIHNLTNNYNYAGVVS